MSSYSQPIASSSFCTKNCTFEAHSYLPVGLSVIPIIGGVIQIIKELQISLKIREQLEMGADENKDTIANLVGLKNRYSVAGAIRGALVGIAVITLVACGILNPIFGGIYAGLCLIGIGINAWIVYHNVTHIIKPHAEGKDFNPRKMV